MNAEITDLSPLSGLKDLRTVILTGSPVLSASPLLELPKLRAFDIGSAKIPVDSMAELTGLPKFLTFATDAAQLTSQEQPASGESGPANVLWTRRGSSNLFDTVTTGPGVYGAVPGIGAFTGVQTGDDLTMIMFLHRRSGTTYRYLATLSENGSDATGMITASSVYTGECHVQPG